MDRLDELKARLLEFRDARDWRQFHDPKNLAEAIAVESGELLENFLWKTPEQSRSLPAEKLDAVKSEMADVLIFLLYLSDVLGVDALAEAERKVALNEQRYSVDKAKGNANKYRDL